MKVLHHSIFEPLPNGHGGEKRSYQIYVEAQENGVAFANLVFTHKESLSLCRICSAAVLLLRVYGVHVWKSLWAFLRQVRNTAYHYEQLVSFFRDSDATVFLWESVRPEWYILPYLARQYGKRVIACPHNIESLVPNQKSALFRMSKKQAFLREVKVLSSCDEVYAISHEETWLLSLWGVKAQCYLYSPVGEVREQMLAIKEQRKQIIEKPFYLLLGTAINPPTRMGMQHIIDVWVEENIQVPLHVGGYGSESLHIPKGQSYVVFLGELTDAQLLEEQVHTRAMLVYQPPTTGALTRIAEAIVADIPIIANYASARSFYNCANVYVYQDDSELLSILSKQCNDI